MSWRVITITGRCKLEHRLEYLVCRGEQTIRVHLSEISVLIIESTAVAITASLLSELIKRKVKVIFCDEKHNPSSELIPLSIHHGSSGRIRRQVRWKEENKTLVWTQIVKHKIFQQAAHLKDRGLTQQAQMLEEYIDEVEEGDITNREGHSAKVYFNALFGLDYSRNRPCHINSALDYGYSILLSAFNREIVGAGYLTNLGLKHDNEFNHFNLSCDLIEPFRPIVDRKVKSMELKAFTSEEKHELQKILNSEIVIDGKRFAVNNAIGVYARKNLEAVESGDISHLDFFEIPT